MKLPSLIERWEVPHKAIGVIHGDIPVVRESSGDYHLISVINSTGLPNGYYYYECAGYSFINLT